MEGGVAPVGIAVLLQPFRSQSEFPSDKRLVFRAHLRDVRQLYGVADHQSPPRAEQQKEVRNGALAGLVDDDEVEQNRAGWETPGGEAGHHPASHRGLGLLPVGPAEDFPYFGPVAARR
ncbi:hypothetical protein [Streptomyces parvulus]|uniref:Uncharacterized protein n=1 Tax=Streptomyces parvulus TaxID=146923 RepID=A0ABV5D996_9ACTN